MSVTSTLTQPVVRSYKVSESSLLSFTRRYLLLYNRDNLQFRENNSEFDETFLHLLRKTLAETENMPGEEIFADLEYKQTKLVLDTMKACRIKYHEIIFFAVEAFGNDNPVLNQFGTNNYLPIRMQQDTMITFMANLYLTAQKYSPQLTGKGCTQALIDEILILKNKLSQEKSIREKMISEHTVSTSERIERYNQLYRICQKINRASKQIFAKNYTKIQEYLLPASDNEKEDIAFYGMVTGKENDQPIPGATITIDVLNVTTETDEFGTFAFVKEMPSGRYNFIASAIGRQTFSGNINIVHGETKSRSIALAPSVE